MQDPAEVLPPCPGCAPTSDTWLSAYNRHGSMKMGACGRMIGILSLQAVPSVAVGGLWTRKGVKRLPTICFWMVRGVHDRGTSTLCSPARCSLPEQEPRPEQPRLILPHETKEPCRGGKASRM